MFKKKMLLLLLSLLICMIAISSVSATDEMAYDNLAIENAVDIESSDVDTADIQSTEENTADIQSTEENTVKVESIDEDTADIQSTEENTVNIESTDENVVNSEENYATDSDEESFDNSQEMLTNVENVDETVQDNPDEVLSDSPAYDSYSVEVENLTVFEDEDIIIPIKITPNPNTEYKYDFYINIIDEYGDEILSDENVFGTTEDTSYNYENDYLDGLSPGIYTIHIYNYMDDELMDTATLTVLEQGDLSVSPAYDSYSVDVKDLKALEYDNITIPIKITPNPNTEYKYNFYVNIYDGYGDEIVSSDYIFSTAKDTIYNYTNDYLDILDPGIYTIHIYNSKDDKLMDTATLTIMEPCIKFTFSKTGTYYNEKHILTIKAIDSNTNKAMSYLDFDIEFSNGDYVSLTTNSKGIATYNIELEPGKYSVKVAYLDDGFYTYECSPLNFEIAKHKGSMTVSQSGKYFGEKKIKVKLMDSVTKGPVKNQHVKIQLSNKKILNAITNSKGVATFNVGIKPGTYSAKVFASNDFVDLPIKKISSIKILKAPAILKSKNLKTTYKSGKCLVLKVVNKYSGKGIQGAKIKIAIKGGKTTTKTTDAKGEIKINSSNLSLGTHKVTMKIDSKKLISGKAKTSKITIKKSGIKINAPNSRNAYKQNDEYKVRITNKVSGIPIRGIKVTMKVFTGKKYKKYTVKTDSNGYASFNTKSLSKTKHKVTVFAKANKYYKSGKAQGSVKMVNKIKTRIICGQPSYSGGRIYNHGVAGNFIAMGASVYVSLYDSHNNELVKKLKVTQSNGSNKTCMSGESVSLSLGKVTFKFAGDSKYMPCKKTISI